MTKMGQGVLMALSLAPFSSWFSTPAMLAMLPTATGTGLGLLSLQPQITDERLFLLLATACLIATMLIWALGARQHFIARVAKLLTGGNDAKPALSMSPMPRHADLPAILRFSRRVRSRLLWLARGLNRAEALIRKLHPDSINQRMRVEEKFRENARERCIDFIENAVHPVLNSLERAAFGSGKVERPILVMDEKSYHFSDTGCQETAEYLRYLEKLAKTLNR